MPRMSIKSQDLLEYLIKEEIKEQVKKGFADAPKMGDIESKKPSYKRPGMKRRPKSGMDVKQHKDMLWAENNGMGFSPEHLAKVWAPEEESPAMALEKRIRNMLNYGLSKKEIYEQLKEEGHSSEDIFLAYHAAKILNREEKVNESLNFDAEQPKPKNLAIDIILPPEKKGARPKLYVSTAMVPTFIPEMNDYVPTYETWIFSDVPEIKTQQIHHKNEKYAKVAHGLIAHNIWADAKRNGYKVSKKSPLQKNENTVEEKIEIPVEKGDTILTGRFKNHPVKVRKINKDDHGMPTINDRKVVNFRLKKNEEKEIKEEPEENLDEFNAMGTGAVVGYTGPLGMKTNKLHKIFWSGDEPLNHKKKSSKITNEEILGKKGGVRYYQLGASLPNKLYNKDKSGKPTRDPGVAGLSSKTTSSPSKKLEKKRKKKKRWYQKEEKIFETLNLPKLFYHGSEQKLPINKVLRARKTSNSVFGPKAEKIVELFRPKNYPSRFESFFMAAHPKYISALGGNEEYVYLVKPKNKVVKVDAGWVYLIYELLLALKLDNLRPNKEQKKQMIDWAQKYWNGEKSPTHSGFEYLTSTVKVEKLTSAGKYKHECKLKEEYYHGTIEVFEPGDLVLPPSITGRISEKGRKKNLDKVFFTKDVGSAKIYAGRASQSLSGDLKEPKVYEIEPLTNSDVEELQGAKGTTVYMAPKAKVIKRVL